MHSIPHSTTYKPRVTRHIAVSEIHLVANYSSGEIEYLRAFLPTANEKNSYSVKGRTGME